MAGYGRKEDHSHGCQCHDHPAHAPARNSHPCCSLQKNIACNSSQRTGLSIPTRSLGKAQLMGVANSRTQYILTPELRLVLQFELSRSFRCRYFEAG